jgi:DNA-binding MarR family transcriptional regulator
MNPNREEVATLEILAAIEASHDVTQRHLATRLGVALGLANSYLKRCVRKGFVKITQAPANRYLYYLTPQGFAEKSRLTGQYLSVSFDFYRRASGSIVQALRRCDELGARRIVFAGVSELAEISSVRSHDFAFDVIGTFDPAATQNTYLGKPLWTSASQLPVFDLALLTALQDSTETYRQLTGLIEAARVIVPDILLPLLDLDVAVVRLARRPGLESAVPSVPSE